MNTHTNIAAQLQAYRGSRRIDGIVIHCSANKAGSRITAEDIDKMHRRRGWNGIGYHFVVTSDGTIQTGRPLESPGAHVSGYNNHTIGICYVGGLDENGKPADTRTSEQKESLLWLIKAIKDHIPGGGRMTVKGHRDYSPDQNRNGVIERFEFIKQCPCFDAIPEYADI